TSSPLPFAHSISLSLTSSTWPPPLLTLRSFFFNDTAPTEIYTLSLHDALPISTKVRDREGGCLAWNAGNCGRIFLSPASSRATRSEEHTSELQSLTNLVCRLLLEKKKRIPKQVSLLKRSIIKGRAHTLGSFQETT